MSLRRVGRFRAVFVGLGGAAAWLGCNALAGIELGTLGPADAGGIDDGTVLVEANGGSGSSDASSRTDAGESDTGMGGSGSSSGSGGDSGDAGNAVDANAPTFVCTPSTRPFAVVSLESGTDGGSRQFQNGGGSVVLGVTSDLAARIVVQVGQGGGGGGGEEFRVYNVRWPGAIDSVWSFAGSGWLINAQPTPTGITAILGNQVFVDGSGSTNLLALPLPSNVQDQGSLPAPYALTVPLGNFNGSANLLELGTDDDFVVTRPQLSNGSTFDSARASRDGGPGLPTLFATSVDQHGDSPILVQGGSNVFAVSGSDPTSDAGVNIYKLPADGRNGAPVTPSNLPMGTLVVDAFPSTLDSTKIATFAAVLTTQLTFYAGLVDEARFDSVQLSSLTQGASLSLHEVPLNKGSTASIGDQIVMAGPSPVASDQGINFVWMDSNARVLGKVTGDTRLYHDHVGIIASTVAPIQSVANVLTSFYVAWIEEPSDDSGLYDVLYVDQVQCAAQ